MIIWIASYPKSGNTWLRALLSSYFFSENGEFNFEMLKKIDSFPSERFFKNYPDSFSKPEDTSKYWIKEQIKKNQSGKITFFKTHNAICKINGNSFTDKHNSLGAIYIVRDPRNIVSSLAHHYQISNEEAFEFMLEEKKGIITKKNGRYIGFQSLFSWQTNQNSWINNKLFPVLTVRYEDFEIETFITFNKVIDFINKIMGAKIPFNKEKAKNCIKSCEFNKLKKMEEQKGFAEAVIKKNSSEKLKFFRMGKDNNYKNLLDKNLIEKINQKFSNQIQKFNYGL